MKRRALSFRAIALLAAGSAAVHQLRYAFGYGDHAGRELAVQGHAYLAALLPFAAALLVVALGSMLRAPLGPAASDRRSLRRSWAAAFAALVLVYVAQELVEGAVAGGHPAGLGGVLTGGGWAAFVIAGAVALFVAIGLRMHGALAEAARARVCLTVGPAPPLAAAVMPVRALLRAAPRLLSARGPPLTSAG